MAACGCGHHAEIDSTTPPSSRNRRASAMAARGCGWRGRWRRYARMPSPSSSTLPLMTRSAPLTSSYASSSSKLATPAAA
uniref:Uncharacterized protein n=1 Tax=Oryza rufipogon TaxID=4529 RepID=A0A0E0Q1J1_ORYRU